MTVEEKRKLSKLNQGNESGSCIVLDESSPATFLVYLSESFLLLPPFDDAKGRKEQANNDRHKAIDGCKNGI